MAEITATLAEVPDASMVGCWFEIGHDDLRRAFALVRAPAEAGGLAWRLASGQLTLVGQSEHLTCESDINWRRAPSGLPSDCITLTCDVAVLADLLCGRAFRDRRSLNKPGDPGWYSVRFTCTKEIPCALDGPDQVGTCHQTWGITIGESHYIECAFLRKSYSVLDPWPTSGDTVQAKQLGEILGHLLSFARSGRGGQDCAIRVTQDRAIAYNVEPTTRQRLVRAPALSPVGFRIAQTEALQLADVLKQIWDADTRLYRQDTNLIFNDGRSRCRVEAPALLAPPAEGPSVDAGVRVDADKLILAIGRIRDQVSEPRPIYFQLDVDTSDSWANQATLRLEIGLPDGEYAQATCRGWLSSHLNDSLAEATTGTTSSAWRVSASGDDVGRLREGRYGQHIDVHLTASTICFTWAYDAVSVRTDMVLERQQ